MVEQVICVGAEINPDFRPEFDLVFSQLCKSTITMIGPARSATKGDARCQFLLDRSRVSIDEDSVMRPDREIGWAAEVD